jgi:zinc transport system substrate-binding protein
MRHVPIALLATACLSIPAVAAPNVVASIKPLHALVSGVMEGVAEPTLIVKGATSPHTYALKPSDAGALESADIVFWTGHGMELFLADALDSLSPNAEKIELSQTAGIELLPTREGGAFEAHVHEGEDGHDHDHAAHEHEGEAHEHEHEHEGEHDHEHAHEGEHNHEHEGDHAHEGEHNHEHEGDHAHEGEHDHEAHEHEHDHAGHSHEHGEGDMHFWLDPENAKLMVREIADTLVAADPDNAEAYNSNAEREIAELEALKLDVQATLLPVKDKPFLVFHDAYQYFEQRFGLTVAGSVTVSPEVTPGAARIDELRAKVTELGATCVFAEPNFEPAIISTITEGTQAKAGVLDPEGSALSEGPGLYGELVRGLADSLVDCLSSLSPTRST